MTCKQVTCFILAALVSCAILTLFVFLLFNGPLDGLFSYRYTKKVTFTYECDVRRCEPLARRIEPFKLRWNAMDSQMATEHCADFQNCLRKHSCLPDSQTIDRINGYCEKYELALKDFGPCREQLVEKAEMDKSSCLEFLLDEKARCQKSPTNRKCLRREINMTCGPETFQKIKPLLPVYFDC